MARIRTIKPEFFTDEKVGECSASARLLFVATWVFADDHGNLERSARQLKAQAFPYDSIDCEPLIRELIDAGLLVEYESAGKKFLHIKNFRLHQKIDKPSKPRVPLYEESETAQRTLAEYSASPRPGRERKGKEGKGKEGSENARARGLPEPEPEPEDAPKPAPASDPSYLRQEAVLAIGLREHGVLVTPDHPIVVGWARDGYTLEQCLQAAAKARETLGPEANIRARYLDQILRDPRNWRRANGRKPASTARTETTEEFEARMLDEYVRAGMTDAEIQAQFIAMPLTRIQARRKELQQ